MRVPMFADVAAAADRLAGVALETPVLTSAALDARAGGQVLVKAELFQHGGAFKFRGAYNRLVQLDAAERSRGVVAFSSGNHAQGVALAARILGIDAIIVMPADAPALKLARTRDYGAQVVTYDRATESREAIAARIGEERSAVVVPSFDDFDIIAGQGTCGLEFARQAAARGVELCDVYTAASGGGLAAGLALAFGELSPATSVHTVEPEGFEDHQRSLVAGRRVTNLTAPISFCDALLAPTPGELTFAVNAGRLGPGLAVNDDEVARAIAFAFHELKVVVEPGGAVALAALLAGRCDAGGGPIGLILSGGNIDPAVHADCLAAWPAP